MLNGSFDVYQRTAKDILYQVPVSGALGLDAPIVNAGSIRNRGFEAALTYNVTARALRLDVMPNFSHNQQQVIKLGLQLRKRLLLAGLPADNALQQIH